MRRYGKGKKILIFILIAPLLIGLVGFIVMSLWNWLVPDLFGGPVITFWQTLGLLLLSKILFGGFKGGPRHYKKRHSMNRWRQKFEDMTPEEKEAFKAKWANRWCKGFDDKKPADEPKTE